MISLLKRVAKRILPLSIVNWIRARRHTDEVTMIAHLCRKTGGVMVDVGAHFGSATASFVELGWSVVAYEPDQSNRAKFLERFADTPGVQLSSSAVSNEERAGVEFFSSKVSTGISGLSAFHGSHVATDTVDTVTLAKDLERRNVRRVDVLKIDVEGFDFFALQGFDWSLRPRFVVYEFENRKTVPLGYTLADSAKYMLDRNYHLLYSVWEPIVEYGISHVWRGLYREPPTDADQSWGNVMCFSDLKDLETCLRHFGKA